ncbi:TlpA disulfide reductase family protein [Ferruginibacter sp.]|uniref:TlpA family protein disulfide reductase n=1 Tax=Ferruginibacter sp. TaxID=1940288 RepID=UPI002658A6FE|nr:TlpA disulfide reductase family protein [Ferruginibacter sp.]
MIKLTYPEPGLLVEYFENRFFVTEKAAVIILNKGDAGKSPFQNYNLINAFDFKKEKDRMLAYSAREESNRRSFVLQHDKEIYHGSDTAAQNENARLGLLILKKNFDYVLKNGNSYYAFVYFRRNLLNLQSPDSILLIFNSTFPDKFKNSEEGRFLKKHLAGKLTVKVNNMAPDFNAKDIDGNKVSLYSFRGKKLVLLTFWATWCGPCITEMPEIRALHDKYSKSLEVISIAYSSQYTTYLKAVKDNNMHWINIYDDATLINDYGGLTAIPRIYLIDKNGKIIYDNRVGEKGDSDLSKLETKLGNLLLEE